MRWRKSTGSSQDGENLAALLESPKDAERGGNWEAWTGRTQATEEACTKHALTTLSHRADDKTAEEYALEGGATLHLVLALRGGSS